MCCTCCIKTATKKKTCMNFFMTGAVYLAKSVTQIPILVDHHLLDFHAHNTHTGIKTNHLIKDLLITRELMFTTHSVLHNKANSNGVRWYFF